MPRPNLGAERIECDGWQVSLWQNGRTGPVVTPEELASFITRLENPERIIKHDHRSSVGLVHHRGATYVIKKFTSQQCWFWFQWTSLLFPALGEVACRNAHELNRSGILTPHPVMLLQRIHRRIVTVSWIVYPYLNGQPAAAQDAEDIVRFIRDMHAAGWIHRDPHPGNFLRTERGMATLDPLRAKPSRSRYLKAYDVILLEHDIPNAAAIYGPELLGFWTILARTGHNLVRGYRIAKYGLRGLLGLKGRRDEAKRKGLNG